MLKRFFEISKNVVKTTAQAAAKSDTLKGIICDSKRLLNKAKDAVPVTIEIKVKKKR